MKQVNKLAAAVAMALGVGFAAPNANATIELNTNGMGDVLIFPVFFGSVDNYFTISNNSGEWIQGHLRFRGAAWSGELRDFDVILSPGDVFVFRVANVDVGDAYMDVDAGDDFPIDEWEIDQTLDPVNFAYTGQVYGHCGRTVSNSYGADCLKPNFRLVPDEPTNALPNGRLVEQKILGYVEFIGEAVLDGMTHNIMDNLLNANLADTSSWKPYQDTLYADIGTHTWLWADGPEFNTCPTLGTNGRCDMGLSDVPNVLSGTAFVYVPGSSQGVAYNAEALANFRTASGHGTHRIDNYRVDASYAPLDGADAIATPTTVMSHNFTAAAPNYDSLKAATARVPMGTVMPRATLNSAVILHENTSLRAGGAAPIGDYVYHPVIPGTETRGDEARVSFNNTWGPTLADGDDYSAQLCAAGVRACDALARDDWESNTVHPDNFLPPLFGSSGNSLAEVEEAIRYGGQDFGGYYFVNTPLPNGGGPLESWYLIHFPTKFYYGEDDAVRAAIVATDPADPHAAYAANRAEYLIQQLVKPVGVEIWDTNEVSGTGPQVQEDGCISPDPCAGAPQVGRSLRRELEYIAAGDLRGSFPNASSFTSGRMELHPGTNADNPIVNPSLSWPMLGYTFEVGGVEFFGQWRSLQRH